MNAKPIAEPVMFIIWHSRPGEKKWHRAGRAPTHAEAVTLIGGRGDWHLAPIYDPRLAGDQLTPERT